MYTEPVDGSGTLTHVAWTANVDKLYEMHCGIGSQKSLVLSNNNGIALASSGG